MQIASFGTGGDLFVFHNGSNSYMQDAGQGILFLDVVRQILLNLVPTIIW